MRRWPARVGIAILLGIAFVAAATTAEQPAPDSNRERAYRSNNLGVALLEQFNYDAAAAAFREALRLDPANALARLNLSIALLYVPDLEGAAREAAQAEKLLPSAPQPPYVRGLAARGAGDDDAAKAFFTRVRAIDPDDTGAAVNLAQIHLQDREFDQAATLLRSVVAQEPYNVTAIYNLGLALTRAGQQDEGRAMMERSQVVRTGGYGIAMGTGYLEQGRYAEAIASTGAERDLVDPVTPPASFTRVRVGGAAPPIGATNGLTLVDVDDNGSLDLVAVSAQGQRLFLNDGRGTFVDATAASGIGGAPRESVGLGAIAGDIDNDGQPDLFVVRSGVSSLYRNDGGGKFSDVTAKAGLTPYRFLPGAAALVDVDHDGDLDVVIAGAGEASAPAPAPLQLHRNNGDGTFTDITQQAGLTTRGHAIAIVPTDVDNRRDIDLLIVNRDGPPVLFKNRRDGTFADVAAQSGLPAADANAFTSVATGDFNKDDAPDFVIGRGNGEVLLARSNGRGGFSIETIANARGAVIAVLALDYDNDGLLDVAAFSEGRVQVTRNLGDRWVAVQSESTTLDVNPSAPASARLVAAGDVDGDGARDLVTGAPDGSIVAWRAAKPTNASLRVQLRGRVSNRSGVGAKVQMRAGSLLARTETSAAVPAVAPADLLFGLGTRAGADVVRVLWPSGVLQAEYGGAPPIDKPAPPPVTPSPIAGNLRVEELDRKPSSCPFLFTWNGERFEFITDFMGGGEMGAWSPLGVGTNTPDPLEHVRIRGDQLRATNGRYSVRVTNELEETLYIDRLELMSISHPSAVEVFPNEGLTDPPKPVMRYYLSDLRPVLRAADDHGHDVTARLLKIDRQFPDDFPLHRIRGYADDHALTLDLGGLVGPAALAMTAWTDYAFSSDNLAASQAGSSLSPPSIDIQAADGSWRRAIDDIGIPVGRPQAMVVDLSKHLRRGEHVVRIRTNMRIYWDQVLVGRPIASTGSERMTHVLSARLHERGFSEPRRPDGREPEIYDYARVSLFSPWKTMAGRFTRPGDVRSLLSRTDDQFVVSKPGDEIELEFDARDDASLPRGWTRTFLLVADGFSKEMDINSASPDTVEPLPYHGMKAYPRSFAPRLPRIERTR